MGSQKRNGLARLLPAHLREEIETLARSREDDTVSVQDWHVQADRLLRRSTALPGPLRELVHRSIKQLASEEREQEQRTGKLIGLPEGADESAIRAAEAELRARVRGNELSDAEKVSLRRRLTGDETGKP